MIEEEIWHEVIDFPLYMVSNLGKIMRISNSKIRQIAINARGFPIVVLFGRGGGESKTRYLRQVNQLVAEAFLPSATFHDETSVWHLDGDLTNCRADNLRWDTRARVIEWNEMNRSREPKYNTRPVENTRTGKVYEDAFACAMDEGRLESEILVRANQDSPRYRWI